MRKEGLGRFYQLYRNTRRENVEKMEIGSFLWCPVMGQELSGCSPGVPKNAHILICTVDKDDDPVGVDYSHFIYLSVVPTRASPLPMTWKNMINKGEAYVRDPLYVQRHLILQLKMITTVLDWLMEVCEVYKLHSETFYLAQDFFDQFMATQQNILKTLLQLIDISSLFIAAKLEEIYPPRLHQFAYVTDGACTEDEILGMESIIKKVIFQMTVVSWLNIYMQVAYLNELYEVLLPQYPQQIFVQTAKLLDLCVLDVGCLEYTYGVLAASALYLFSSSELMHICLSGYEWCEIEECVKWMVPFAMAIREVGSSKLKHFRHIAPEDLDTIQMHINSLDLLDKAQAKQALLAEQNRTSPFPTGVLTPPLSSKKQSSPI
uniref:Uncharacterized protein n=1 Tax=Melopsittacus undulatus TaxID=13146 RepID=A0A8V5H208_MELUD